MNKKEYVPKEIGLLGRNSSLGSILILNDLGQLLGKTKGKKSYLVDDDFNHNENTGKNYFYKKVKFPLYGKLYYVTNKEDLSFKLNLDNYVIYLEKNLHCFWEKSVFGMYNVGVSNGIYEHYYEIVRLD